jgi:nucleotide-binding universal stress UspA family protein
MELASHASNPSAPRPHLAPRRVLVATALGEHAVPSLRIAIARAAGWGAELAICHVGDTDRRGVARQALESCGDAAVDCAVFAEHGDVAVAVARRADSWDADLIVVGGAKASRGDCRCWHSDVGWDIVRRAPCPVLITRHTHATGRMVVGTDLGDASMAAVRAAALEQARTGAAAALVHCGARTADEAAAFARMDQIAVATGLRATRHLVAGPPAIGLVEVASELAADLVVVGGGSRRLGGVAERVACEAPGAVLIVG